MIDQYLDTIRSTTHYRETARSPDARWIVWTIDLRQQRYMTMWAVTRNPSLSRRGRRRGDLQLAKRLRREPDRSVNASIFAASVYDPAIYARSSSITLTYEFWHALKAEGVKTQFVVSFG